MIVSRPVRRIVAFALPVLLCAGIWTLIAAPALEQIAGDRQDIARYRDALRRFERLEADVPAMRRRLDDLRRRTDDGSYLVATSPALMAAVMQGKAQEIVSSTHALLRSSRTLQGADSEKGFARVGVELDLSASAPDLARLLHAVAAAKPDVVVEHLAVQVPETGPSPDESDVQPKFDVVLTLASYAKGPAAGAGP